MGDLDQRLHGVGAADPADGQDQLALDLRVFFFFQRHDQRHREGAGLAAAHADRGLNANVLGLVPQRAAQRLSRAARADLGERQRHLLADPLVGVVELFGERGHRGLEPLLSQGVGHVPHDEPLRVAQHVNHLVPPLLHVHQRVEQPAPFLNRARGREQIEQHFHAVRARALQHHAGRLFELRGLHQLGESVEQRPGDHALERDRVHAARARILDAMLQAHHTVHDRHRLLEFVGLHRRFHLAVQHGERVADVGTLRLLLQLRQHILCVLRQGEAEREVRRGRVAGDLWLRPPHLRLRFVGRRNGGRGWGQPRRRRRSSPRALDQSRGDGSRWWSGRWRRRRWRLDGRGLGPGGGRRRWRFVHGRFGERGQGLGVDRADARQRVPRPIGRFGHLFHPVDAGDAGRLDVGHRFAAQHTGGPHEVRP